MNSRRKALKSLFNGSLLATTGGLAWGTVAATTTKADLTLRPPGARKENDFIKACIKCGQCVEACPYDTLKLADVTEGHTPGTPYFTPREIPCYMCTNIPCTYVCPSGALDVKLLIEKQSGKPSINEAKMGLAVIHRESCIAYEGIQCDACYRACPLMNDAITLEMDVNQFTHRHANLKPVVHSDKCTGCGVCEHACVVEKAAIFVLPREHATGMMGDHYIRSWKNEEDKLKEKSLELNDDEDIKNAIEYLNDDEDLFEE